MAEPRAAGWRRDDGVTTSGVLVVVAILGVLALVAVVVVNVTRVTRPDAAAACSGEVHTIQAAIDAYRSDHETDGRPGTYPTTGSRVTDWSALTAGPTPYLHAAPTACTSFDIDPVTDSVTGHLDGRTYH